MIRSRGSVPMAANISAKRLTSSGFVCFLNRCLLRERVAERIDCDKRIVSTRSPDGVTESFRYGRLVIATGAKPVLPNIPGIEHIHPLHTMSDSFRVHALVTSGRIHRAAVVGVGYIGVEMADALSHRGVEVELVGRSSSILPTVDPEIGNSILQEIEKRHVRVHTGKPIGRIRKVDEHFIVDGPDGFAIKADLIVWATGVSPASDLVRAAGVETGIRAACKVTRRMETNIPNVYAAGDCAETWHRMLEKYTWLPLGTTAHKQGRVAGENAIGGDAEFAGIVGTQVVKVFDLAIARTGLLDGDAAASGFSPATVHAKAYDHKAYYPGAAELQLRVTGDVRTGRLLGAQIAGHWKAEVAKRIDVFATALFHRMNINDINALDLSYTPPLGSPWDAVQIAAQTWTARQRKTTREVGDTCIK
jgi:NADPH-dependent 2,4-dienoyl-CoA reductase/sulfur reductase-like enzyme